MEDEEGEIEEFDKEFDDVIETLQLYADNEVVLQPLPDDFSAIDILSELQVKDSLTPMQTENNKCIAYLTDPDNSERMDHFCRQQFHELRKIIDPLKKEDLTAVKQDELTKVYKQIHTHQTGTMYQTQCRALFPGNNTSASVFHVCFNLTVAIRKYLLKKLS